MASELGTLTDIERHGNLNPHQKMRLDELRAAGNHEGRADGVIQMPGSATQWYDSGAGFVPGVDPGGGFGGAGGVGGFDLETAYKNLYDASGIKNTQNEYDILGQQLTERQKARNTAQAKINDNPFYSEGTRVGRAAKLDQQYNNDVQALTQQQANLQNKIAQAKADVETQMNIKTKQFDINNQLTQQAINQFNTLLSAGALDGASGTDIANITRSTGMSSSMIQSAINASREAKKKDQPTQIMQFDDGDNTGYVVINPQTGDIINKQVIAQSKPSAAEIKAASGGSGGSTKSSAADQKNYYATALRQDAAKGLTLSQIFSLYTGYLKPDEIYQLYNANSKYGPDRGDIKNLAKYGVTQKK